MLKQLKSHPFAIEAYFDSSLVLAFAIPKEELETMIPECLTLDTFQDKWAFIAAAMVQTKKLRPKGFPKFLGKDFFLSGFRIFVRYKNKAGKNLRGLYILRSETNSYFMKTMGNLLTHYNYTKVNIDQTVNKLSGKLTSSNGLFIDYSVGKKNISLPENSPFKDWKEARRFAGPLPFTFTYDSTTKKVLIVEGVRSNWKPAPVEILNFNIPFIEELGIKSAVLANAFVVENIPYYWKKAKTETWKPSENPSKAS